MTSENTLYLILGAIFLILYSVAKVLDALGEIKASSKQTNHLLSLLIDKISGRETY